MDHSGHSGMDHGGGMGGGHDMEPICSMNMIFTWDTNNLCIVFKWWRIHSTATLIFSLLGVVLLTAGYELVREISRKYESREALAASVGRKTRSSFDGGARLDAGMETPQDDAESSSLLWAGNAGQQPGRQSKMVKAMLYAVQVFYSFFIMLLFMTYNGWVMLAVAVGAFVGYLAFGNSSVTKSVACH